MATGNKNNRSEKKNIRFPYELIESITASVQRKKENDLCSNFSAWVIDACEQKLRTETSEE